MSDNGFAGRSSLFRPHQRRYLVRDIDGVGKCRFQSFTERERGLWEQRPFNKKTGDPIPAKQREQRRALIAYLWVDGEGNRCLSDGDISCAESENFDSRIVADMALAAMEVSGLTESDIDDEDAVKNSEPTQDD